MQAVKRIEVDSFIIHVLFILINLSAITYILITQDNLNTSSWWAIHRSIKVGISLLCVLFILLYYSYIGRSDSQQIRVICCLLYVLLVAVLEFYPSVKILLSDVFAWPLTLLVTYMYSLSHEDIQRFRSNITFCHYVCCAVLIRSFVLKISGEYVNIGSVYHAISYLPIVMMLAKRRDKTILSILSCVLVALSAKRTGVLALSVGLIGYAITNIMIQQRVAQKVKRIVLILMIGFVGFSVAFYFPNISERVFGRFFTIQEDLGSGRIIIWQLVYARFKSSSFLNKLIGHGIQAVPYTIRPFDKALFAHNSYLEYLYDLGIIGFCMLTVGVIRMTLFSVKITVAKNKLAPATFFALCVILAFSMFSYCFEESNYILMLAAFWGIALGTYTRETRC